jgi:hypothetical protein
LAITTWFAAIELNSGSQPQRVVAESGAFLRDHEAFLETRSGLPDLLDNPVNLPEHLHAAAFCRLEAVDKFSNTAGGCVFASVCIDTMADKSVETGRQTLTMQPAQAGTLCTTNPSQSEGLKGEEELRNSYGAELMAALAHSLSKLATTGSLRDPFVGQFPNFTQNQIFSARRSAAGLKWGRAGYGPGDSEMHRGCRRVLIRCQTVATNRLDRRQHKSGGRWRSRRLKHNQA